MTKKFGCLIVALCIGTPLWSQDAGTIKGIVVDEEGKPVAKAKVHIAETKAFSGHRIVGMYETSDKGQFAIPNVPWGTYSVMAGKEDAGYPDTRFAFYSNLAVPTVTLAPSYPAADISVALPPKAGILELAPVTNVDTGKAIDSASVTLRRTQNPNFFIHLSATKRIPIPSDTDVSIEISAPGYRSWPPTDQETLGRVHLKPNEVFKLDVRLTPE